MLCCGHVTCIYIRVSSLPSDRRADTLCGYSQMPKILCRPSSRCKVINISRDPQVENCFSKSDTKLNSSKLICFKSTQHAEHLKHKQGHLLKATHSTRQIKKLIFFLSGVLGECFRTNNFIRLCLGCFVVCFSPCVRKYQNIVPLSRCCGIASSATPPPPPKDCFMSKLSTCWDCFFSLLQLCLCENGWCWFC